MGHPGRHHDNGRVGGAHLAVSVVQDLVVGFEVGDGLLGRLNKLQPHALELFDGVVQFPAFVFLLDCFIELIVPV